MIVVIRPHTPPEKVDEVIREIAALGGNVSEFVHPVVAAALRRHREAQAAAS